MTQHPIPVGTTVYVEADARLAKADPTDEHGGVYFAGGVIGTVVGPLDDDGDYLVEATEEGPNAGLVQYVGKAFVAVPVAAEEG